MIRARRWLMGLMIDEGAVRIARLTAGSPPRLARWLALPADGQTPEAIAGNIRRAWPHEDWRRAVVTLTLARQQTLAPSPASPDSAIPAWAVRRTLALPVAVCERLGASPQRALFTSQGVLGWYRVMRPDALQGGTASALLDVQAQTAELILVADERLRWTRALPSGRSDLEALAEEVAVSLREGQEHPQSPARQLYITSVHPLPVPLAIALQRRFRWRCELIDPWHAEPRRWAWRRSSAPAALTHPTAARQACSPVAVWGAALSPWETPGHLWSSALQQRHRSTRPHQRRRRTRSLAVACCLTATASAAHHVYQRARYQQALQAQVTAMAAESDRVDLTARRVALLRLAAQDQDMPARVITTLEQAVPPAMALSSLTYDATDGLLLQASVTSMDQALALLRALQATSLLAQTALVSATQRPARTAPVVDVELRCPWPGRGTGTSEPSSSAADAPTGDE